MASDGDTIDDTEIGSMWTKHFPQRADVKSKTVVLSLVYIIEEKARMRASDGDWSDHVSHELRRYGIPAVEFWEIYKRRRGSHYLIPRTPIGRPPANHWTVCHGRI